MEQKVHGENTEIITSEDWGENYLKQSLIEKSKLAQHAYEEVQRIG
jgi:hypothetical protein